MCSESNVSDAGAGAGARRNNMQNSGKLCMLCFCIRKQYFARNKIKFR